jgi:hypothetical protein
MEEDAREQIEKALAVLDKLAESALDPNTRLNAAKTLLSHGYAQLQFVVKMKLDLEKLKGTEDKAPPMWDFPPPELGSG